MHVTFTGSEREAYLRELQRRLTKGGHPCGDIEDGVLHCGKYMDICFTVDMFRIIPLNYPGKSLPDSAMYYEAPLIQFLSWCAGCNQWEFSARNLVYIPGALEGGSLQDWLAVQCSPKPKTPMEILVTQLMEAVVSSIS